jgi:opacity protein-like surface antigen
MTRVVRLAAWCLVVIAVVGAADARAQTVPAAASQDSRFFADVNGGATFGAKSGSSVGLEVGARLFDGRESSGLDVLIEGGRMGTIGNAALDARAKLIADVIGGTSSASYHVTFGDIGVRYRLPMAGMVKPYVVLGVGIAKVETRSTYTVNGIDVTSQLLSTYGVQLGADLTDSLNKTMVMLGGGVNVTFAGRFFGDLSYRYGQILPKTDVIELDTAVKTQRLQVGVGVRF